MKKKFEIRPDPYPILYTEQELARFKMINLLYKKGLIKDGKFIKINKPI